MPNPLITQADMQRIDMGIAMCHCDLAARELGLKGEWEKHDPNLELTVEDRSIFSCHSYQNAY